MKTLLNAAQPSTGQGGDEHESARTSVRKRASAGANAGMGRIGGER